MVLSAATEIYIGVSACTEIYVGDTQVWHSSVPPTGQSNYLTFEILDNGYMYIRSDCVSAQTIEYRINGGLWNTMNVYNSSIYDSITVSIGDIVEWRGNNITYADENTYSYFASNVRFNVYGNILSLFYGDYADIYNVFPSNYALSFLFFGSEIVSASGLTLPNTVTERCYYGMFYDCGHLVNAPVLPAEVLAKGCYYSMFDGCYSLTNAPLLPAQNIATSAYNDMFYGCSSLKYIKCMAESGIRTSNLSIWVSNVSSNGTFVKKAGVSWPSGDSGIPNGWTVIEEN